MDFKFIILRNRRLDFDAVGGVMLTEKKMEELRRGLEEARRLLRNAERRLNPKYVC